MKFRFLLPLFVGLMITILVLEVGFLLRHEQIQARDLAEAPESLSEIAKKHPWYLARLKHAKQRELRRKTVRAARQ